MVLRIEDLDPRAQSREAARLIMDDLHWLGLDWDEGPFWQSERGEVYEAAIERLGGSGIEAAAVACASPTRASAREANCMRRAPRTRATAPTCTPEPAAGSLATRSSARLPRGHPRRVCAYPHLAGQRTSLGSVTLPLAWSVRASRANAGTFS